MHPCLPFFLEILAPLWPILGYIWNYHLVGAVFLLKISFPHLYWGGLHLMVYLFTLVENQNSISIMFYNIIYIIYQPRADIRRGRMQKSRRIGKRQTDILIPQLTMGFIYRYSYTWKSIFEAKHIIKLFAFDPKIVPLQNAISMYHTTGEQNMLCVTGLCYEHWIAFWLDYYLPPSGIIFAHKSTEMQSEYLDFSEYSRPAHHNTAIGNMAERQGGKSWQPFVEGKIAHKNFR